jgi:hypothetical protein
MRTEDGVFCDSNDRKCLLPAITVHPCKVEGSEFALCRGHSAEFNTLIANRPHLQIRCPRCIPQFLSTVEQAGNLDRVRQMGLPSPITGPLAEAIDEAMYREGVLGPTRDKVLRRLNAQDDSYVAAIFRSTAAPKATGQEQPV